MGVKISNLPVIVTPALTDVFPVVQGGVTYQESFTQFTSLFATAGANANITSLSGLTTPLSIAQGGTGSATGDPVFHSVAFSPTTRGIVGTLTNDAADVGFVGEFIESTVLIGASVALTTATPADITSIALTPGDWDVCGTVWTNPNVATTTSSTACWTSSVSATIPTAPHEGGFCLYQFATVAGAAVGVPAGERRYSLAVNTTVYLSISVAFAVNTNAAYGYIRARRAR